MGNKSQKFLSFHIWKLIFFIYLFLRNPEKFEISIFYFFHSNPSFPINILPSLFFPPFPINIQLTFLSLSLDISSNCLKFSYLETLLLLFYFVIFYPICDIDQIHFFQKNGWEWNDRPGKAYSIFMEGWNLLWCRV